MLVGILSAGAFGAMAASNTEAGFSTPQAFNYTLNKKEEETREVVSYSVVDIGGGVCGLFPLMIPISRY